MWELLRGVLLSGSQLGPGVPSSFAGCRMQSPTGGAWLQEIVPAATKQRLATSFIAKSEGTKSYRIFQL